jgi:GNAT superfamily N-acetyltransferase
MIRKKTFTYRDGTFLNLIVVAYHLIIRGDKIVGAKFKAIEGMDSVGHGKLVSVWEIEPMSGCNGIAIFKKVEIMEEYRGKGLGTQFLNLRETLAKDFGYSSLLCTIVDTNEPQKKIMDKLGWKLLNQFTNSHTSNNVLLYGKNI